MPQPAAKGAITPFGSHSSKLARVNRPERTSGREKKIATSGMPKEVREKADQELRRLEAMPPVSAEATVSRNYI